MDEFGLCEDEIDDDDDSGIVSIFDDPEYDGGD